MSLNPARYPNQHTHFITLGTAISSIRSHFFATKKPRVDISLTSPVVPHCLFLFISSYLSIKKQIIKLPTIYFILLFPIKTPRKETALGFIAVENIQIRQSPHYFRFSPLKRNRRDTVLIALVAIVCTKMQNVLKIMAFRVWSQH